MGTLVCWLLLIYGNLLNASSVSRMAILIWHWRKLDLCISYSSRPLIHFFSSNTNVTQLCNAGYGNSLVCCIVLSWWCNRSFWKGYFFLQKILPTALWEISTCHSICLYVLVTKCYISSDHVLALGILLILYIIMRSSVYSLSFCGFCWFT
jgi:hypothetical protein